MCTGSSEGASDLDAFGRRRQTSGHVMMAMLQRPLVPLARMAPLWEPALAWSAAVLAASVTLRVKLEFQPGFHPFWHHSDDDRRDGREQE